MLGKLIKYDLKSCARIITSVYVFIVLCALSARIMLIIYDVSDGTFKSISRILFATLSFILILSIITACVITLVMVVLRYRNNLLRDEGYLMHTLPVSPVKLYYSKIVTAMLLFITDIVVIIFSIAELSLASCKNMKLINIFSLGIVFTIPLSSASFLFAILTFFNMDTVSILSVIFILSK